MSTEAQDGTSVTSGAGVSTLPTVSILLCTYNGSRYLDQQLASLAAQTHAPDEILVFDDASTDDTLRVLRSAAQRLRLPIVVSENPTRLGFSENFSRGLLACTGRYVFLCDQDDWWLPTKVAESVQALERTGAALVASDTRLMSADAVDIGTTHFALNALGRNQRRMYEHGESFAALLKLRVLPGHTMALRSDIVPLVVPVPEPWVHDAWISVVAAALGDVVLLPDPTVRYRRHADQSIGAGNLSRKRRMLQSRRDPDYFVREARMFWLLRQRLAGTYGERFDDLLQRRIRFAQERARIHRSGVAGCVRLLRLTARGDYAKFSQGPLAVARDLRACLLTAA